MQDVQHITPEEAHKPVVSSRKSILFTTIAALGAGLVASLTSAAILLVLRVVAGIPTPIELFGDHLLKLLPAARFVDMLVYFGLHSKTAPLGLALVGMIGLGTLLGVLYAAINWSICCWSRGQKNPRKKTRISG